MLAVSTASRSAVHLCRQSYLGKRAQRYPFVQVRRTCSSPNTVAELEPLLTVPDMSLKSTSASIIRFLQARFAELGSEGNSISVTIDSSAPWWIADRQHPYSKAAEQAVLQECGVSASSPEDLKGRPTKEGASTDPTVMDQRRGLAAFPAILGEPFFCLRRSPAHGLARRSCTFG